MGLINLYYFGRNIYWITSTVGNIIPNSIWCIYNIYRVSEFAYTNTTYVARKARDYCYGEQKKEKIRVILIKEKDDFIIIDN